MNAKATLLPPALRSKLSAANQLGVPVGAVRAWIASGELRTLVIPPGNRVKILQSSIDEKYKQLYGDVNEAV